MSETTQPSRISRRTLKLALMGSLALNVLIIGGIIGSLCFSTHGPRRPGPKSGGLLGFAHTLPSDRADFIRQKVADAQGNLEGLRKAERDARYAARQLLIAEPFDEQKLADALQSAAAADAREKSARMALFAATAAQLTPDERRLLYEWLEKRRPRR